MSKSLPMDRSLYTMSSENLFTLSVLPSIEKTTIIMKLLIPEVNTTKFPETSLLLKSFLPSIFHSTCYNDEGLGFMEEVKCTEVGHLFEHILLEYLCLQKLERGFDTASYEGVTNWNWIQEPRGTFHITITATYEDFQYFKIALEQTIKLTNVILLQNISCALTRKTKLLISNA